MSALRELTLWRYPAIAARIGPARCAQLDVAIGSRAPVRLEHLWPCGCRAIRVQPEIYRWERCARHEPVANFSA